MIRTLHPTYAVIALVALLAAPMSLAGTPGTPTTNNFDAAGTPFTVTQNGNAPGTVAGPTGNYYRLTENINGQNNFIAFNRTELANRSATISASFNFRVGEGSASPADGLGFALFDNGQTTGQFSWGGGETPSATNIIVGVGFPIYNALPATQSICRLFSRGQQIAQFDLRTLATPYVVYKGDIDPATTAFDNCQVDVDALAGTVTVRVTPAGGAQQTVFNAVAVPNLTPFRWRAAFGARTGGQNAEFAIDDVSITSTGDPDVSAPTITAVPDVQFFTTPVNVTVTNTETGGTTYYTTDGSLPTTTNGVAVATSATFAVSTTTLVRARTFNTGKLALDVQRQFTLLRSPDAPTNDAAAGVRGRMYLVVGGGGTLPDFSTPPVIFQKILPSPFIADAGSNPFNSAQTTNYSAQFDGYISVPTDGVYTFYTASDDGSRLFIGNTMVVDNNFSQGVTERSGQIGLLAGKHAILVQFGQGGGGAGLFTRYEGPGIAKTDIPASVFTTVPVAENPVIGIGGGNTFTTQATVTITSSTGAPTVIPTIYYTLDGTDPTPDSHTGSFPSGGTFQITQTSTVRALAYLPPATGFSSAIAAATFTRNVAPTDAPKLQSAKATSTTQVDAIYDIAMGTGVAVPANYAISGGIGVTGAVLDADGKTVHLTVSPALDPIVTYSLTVGNVLSGAGTPIGSFNNVKFRVLPNGVYFERFDGINGTLVSNLTSAPAFIANTPSSVAILPNFNFLTLGDLYGTRMRATLVVPETGDYNFRLRGDDETKLFIATDNIPANKVNSLTANVNTVTTAAPVNLTAGQLVYLEVLQKEGGGGDDASLQWSTPSSAGAFALVPSTVLLPFSTAGVAPVGATGMLRERYYGIPGGAIVNLTSNAKYPNFPDETDIVLNFVSPNFGNALNDYGLRLSGFYTPTVSENVNFYICGDDDCELWMSPTADPAGAVKICQKLGGPYGLTDWVPPVGEADQKSADIAVVAGQRYYIFALMKEGGGGDGVAVTVTPVGTPPVNGTTQAIAGSFLTPATKPFAITQQSFSKRVRYGTSTTLNVAASGGVLTASYQWFKNGTKIGGSTGRTLTLNNVTGADTATYTCEASGTSDGLSLIVLTTLPIQVQVFADISLDTATLTQTYNAANRIVTATTAPAALPYSVTYNTNPTAVNAGTYAVVASATGGVEAIANGTLTVNPAALTVTADPATREYGQPEPTFTATVTGFFAPDTNALVTGTPSFTTTAVINSNIGTYPITPVLGTLGAGGNYIFPGANFVNGVLTVTKATNASVAVNAQGSTIFYDGQSHVATSVTTPAGLTVTYTYNGSSTAPVNAGVYNVVGTISDNNADLTTDIPGNGTLTISKVALTATGTLLTRTYGDTSPILPATPAVGTDYTLSGFVNGEGAGVVSGTPTLSTTAVAATTGPDTPGSPAGDYVITLASNMGLTATNYDVATFQPGTLRIGKRPVNVQAQSISLEYGQPNPQTLNYTVVPSSLAPGDTAAIAITNGEPGVSSTRTPTSPVGVYPITLTPGTLTFSPNYQLGTTANGTITVTQATTAAVTIPATTLTYNGAPQGVTPVITPAGLNADVTYNGFATLPTNAGTYAVVATINDPNAAGNPSGNGTLTIVKATATVSLFNLFQTENGTPRPVTVVTSPANLTVNVTYNGSATAPTLPGIYAVVVTINEPNYQGTSNAQLRVGGPPPLITSPLTGTPNPVQVGKTVTFSIAATHPLNLPLTITYDYGDGVSDATGVHVYTFPQIATVTASVSDGVSTITSTIQVLVVSAASPEGDLDGDGINNAIDTDDDGDGLSDIFEDAIGSSPLDAGNLPLDDPNQAKNPGPLDVKKMSIKLSFTRLLSDSITIGGTLPVKAGFTGANKKLVVDVGGVIKSFTLGPKNTAKVGGDSVKLTVKAKKGVVGADQAAKFSIKISKGTFSSTLADDGLGNETAKNKVTTVRVDVLFNGQYLRKLVSQIYTAKQGSSGRTK